MTSQVNAPPAMAQLRCEGCGGHSKPFRLDVGLQDEPGTVQVTQERQPGCWSLGGFRCPDCRTETPDG